MKNLAVISLLSVLLFHNVLALYTGVVFANVPLSGSTFTYIEPSDELSFTESDCNVINQFIFDSEFKNVNANISVFEEHKNLISEIKPLFEKVTALSSFSFTDRVTARSILASLQFCIPNSCKQVLQGNLFSFRI